LKSLYSKTNAFQGGSSLISKLNKSQSVAAMRLSKHNQSSVNDSLMADSSYLSMVDIEKSLKRREKYRKSKEKLIEVEMESKEIDKQRQAKEKATK